MASRQPAIPLIEKTLFSKVLPAARSRITREMLAAARIVSRLPERNRVMFVLLYQCAAFENDAPHRLSADHSQKFGKAFEKCVPFEIGLRGRCLTGGLEDGARGKIRSAGGPDDPTQKEQSSQGQSASGNIGENGIDRPKIRGKPFPGGGRLGTVWGQLRTSFLRQFVDARLRFVQLFQPELTGLTSIDVRSPGRLSGFG